MRGDASACQRYARGAELGHIGGTQRAGDQNAAGCTGLHARCSSRGAPAQASQIVRPLGEHRVRQQGQLSGEVVGRLAKRVRSGKSTIGDERVHTRDQAGIASHQNAGLDDVCLVFPAGLAQARGDRVQLSRREL